MSSYDIYVIYTYTHTYIILTHIHTQTTTLDVLRAYVNDMYTVLKRTLDEDNEENALLAVKIILNLHRFNRTTFESSVQVRECVYVGGVYV